MSIAISLLLIIVEAVIVTLLLRRINKLEARIFIRKRVLRPQESPILRQNPVSHPAVACSFAAAPRGFNTCVHPGLSESIALLHRNGLSVSANTVPLTSSAPTADNDYVTIPVQGAIGFKHTTLGQHP